MPPVRRNCLGTKHTGISTPIFSRIQVLLCFSLLSLLLSAGDIGMIQTVRIEIPGEKLEAVPVDERAPAVVRVEVLAKTGTGYLYAIDFVGLEPGDYDVIRYLRTAAGEPPSAAPCLVSVERRLPESFRGEISAIPRRVGLPPAWYRPTAVTLSVLWVLCLPLLIFAGRRNVEIKPEPEAAAPTLQERLQALVDGMGEQDGKEAWQKLEATLMQYLAESRRISGAKAFDTLLALKRDAVAGPVLRQFEHCLHAPGGRRRESLDRALAECVRVLEVRG